MNFSVLWRQPASDAMFAQLLRANDKPAMMAAAREIERRLARNPAGEGEGRGANRRLLFVRPLSILFTIDDDARTVYVERVKWVGG